MNFKFTLGNINSLVESSKLFPNIGEKEFYSIHSEEIR